MGVRLSHDSRMRPRDILAANINALIDDNDDFKSPAKLVEASGVSNGTLGRIRNAEIATTVDQLGRLATAFGVEPWELLVPPEQRKAMHALTEAIKAMPKDGAAPSAEANAAPARRKRQGPSR